MIDDAARLSPIVSVNGAGGGAPIQDGDYLTILRALTTGSATPVMRQQIALIGEYRNPNTTAQAAQANQGAIVVELLLRIKAIRHRKAGWTVCKTLGA